MLYRDWYQYAEDTGNTSLMESELRLAAIVARIENSIMDKGSPHHKPWNGKFGKECGSLAA